MTAGVVWVDHFEGLEKAVICFSGEVACDLGCQDVEVRISGCQLLHRFQIQLQDDRSMGCSRWRCPARWTMKRWGTHSGRRCSGRRAWSSGGRDVVAGHGSLLTISIQVNAERHNKIADGMCTMKVQKVQGGQRCNNGWDNGNKVVSGWKYTFATWNGETYTAAFRRWWNVSAVNPFSVCTSQVLNQVCLWAYSTLSERQLRICPSWSRSHATKIEISHQISKYEVFVFHRQSNWSKGSGNGISTVREVDGVSRVLWELLWPSVCVLEVSMPWLRASMVLEGHQAVEQQHVDVVQED